MDNSQKPQNIFEEILQEHAKGQLQAVNVSHQPYKFPDGLPFVGVFVTKETIKKQVAKFKAEQKKNPEAKPDFDLFIFRHITDGKFYSFGGACFSAQKFGEGATYLIEPPISKELSGGRNYKDYSIYDVSDKI